MAVQDLAIVDYCCLVQIVMCRGTFRQCVSYLSASCLSAFVLCSPYKVPCVPVYILNLSHYPYSLKTLPYSLNRQ